MIAIPRILSCLLVEASRYNRIFSFRVGIKTILADDRFYNLPLLLQYFETALISEKGDGDQIPAFHNVWYAGMLVSIETAYSE